VPLPLPAYRAEFVTGAQIRLARVCARTTVEVIRACPKTSRARNEAVVFGTRACGEKSGLFFLCPGAPSASKGSGGRKLPSPFCLVFLDDTVHCTGGSRCGSAEGWKRLADLCRSDLFNCRRFYVECALRAASSLPARFPFPLS